MFLNAEKTEQVFKKVKMIKEHKDLYCLDPQRIPVSIEDLRFVVSDMYDLKIGIQEVVFQGSRVRSLVERYNNQHALIYVKHDLTDDLKRLSVSKELMHLAIDEQEDWSVDGVNTISHFLAEMALATKQSNEAVNGAQSEALAEIAAIEILYPYEFRAKDAVDRLNDQSLINKLSLNYEVPSFIIGKALSDWYGRIADEMWNKLNS
jgi:Zn-dependent peptidase ImmA (M78 family)